MTNRFFYEQYQPGLFRIMDTSTGLPHSTGLNLIGAVNRTADLNRENNVIQKANAALAKLKSGEISYEREMEQSAWISLRRATRGESLR